MKFNPVNKSMTYIGPDFGDDMMWCRGAMTDNGIIYCPPYDVDRGILKIDTNTDTVTELDRNLPEQGNYMWRSYAATLDGCTCCMPYNGCCIMKLDPNNNDAMTTSVGDGLGDGTYKFWGTVVVIDGCVYGIHRDYKHIVRCDPINDTTSFVEEAIDKGYRCNGSGALGRDGCIYAFTRDGRVLKIDTTNNSHCFAGDTVEKIRCGFGWGDAILGIDGCIYSPPTNACHILKYDQTSLVGDDFESYSYYKWYGGSLASDEVIYCFPLNAERILSIDPWKVHTSSLESNMVQHPEQLGCLFRPSADIPNETNFDRAVTKFGYKKVMGVLEPCMPPADGLCMVSNLYPPLIIVALYKRSDISMIYHLLCKAPFSVHCIGNSSSYDEDSRKKRKRLANKTLVIICLGV